MYDELIERLKASCESCKLWDGYKCCLKGECSAQKSLQAADAIEELLASCKNFEAALKDSVEECEKLQQYADLYKDLTEKSQKVAMELKQQFQKSEEDNVNLTGWLAEEHANQCPYYIRNVHDRGDDSLCTKWECEVKALPKWIPVTERLPEENGHYLVHAVGNGYCSTYIALWNGRFRANFEMPIKHWMPLPQPPERG